MSFTINVSNNFGSGGPNITVSNGCGGTSQTWEGTIPPGDDIYIPSPGDCTDIQLDGNSENNWSIEICPPLDYECDSDKIINVEKNDNCLKISLEPVESGWVITLKRPSPPGISQPTNVTIGDN